MPLVEEEEEEKKKKKKKGRPGKPGAPKHRQRFLSVRPWVPGGGV